MNTFAKVALYLSSLASCYVADESLYVMQHMANKEITVEHGLEAGANALEIDINCDKNTGMPTRFHHGTPCDCTCLDIWFTFSGYSSNVCDVSEVCSGGLLMTPT